MDCPTPLGLYLLLLVTTSMTYKLSTKPTLEEVLQIEKDLGRMLPAIELEPLSKAELKRYITHVQTQVIAKNLAIETLSETFEKSIEKLTAKCLTTIQTEPAASQEELNAKIEKLQDSIDVLQAHPPLNNTRNLPTIENNCVSKPEKTKIKSHEALTECLLGQDHVTELSQHIETLNFTSISTQRDVHYVGDYDYKYTGGEHAKAPIPEPYQKIINKAKELYPGEEFNSILTSRYKNGSMFCPPHSDDEKAIKPHSHILTFSIGATRDMMFIRRAVEGNDGETVSVSLPHNSLLASTRQSQSYWRHSIPSDDSTDIRYSLTIRCIDPHYLKSTIIFGDSNTKHLKFGNEQGTFGSWMPGKRVKAQNIKSLPEIEDIHPYQNIVIHVGVNDICNGLSPDEYMNKLRDKCSQIHNVYPSTRILLSPILPTRLHQLNERIWDINERIVTLSKTHHNLVLMDNSIFADKNNFLRSDYASYYTSDNVHLGSAGIRALANSIKSYVFRRNPSITRSMNYSSAYKSEQPY